MKIKNSRETERSKSNNKQKILLDRFHLLFKVYLHEKCCLYPETVSRNRQMLEEILIRGAEVVNN